jgi:hypothetical protein
MDYSFVMWAIPILVLIIGYLHYRVNSLTKRLEISEMQQVLLILSHAKLISTLEEKEIITKEEIKIIQ